jgi:hypothetical protein
MLYVRITCMGNIVRGSITCSEIFTGTYFRLYIIRVTMTTRNIVFKKYLVFKDNTVFKVDNHGHGKSLKNRSKQLIEISIFSCDYYKYCFGFITAY